MSRLKILLWQSSSTQNSQEVLPNKNYGCCDETTGRMQGWVAGEEREKGKTWKCRRGAQNWGDLWSIWCWNFKHYTKHLKLMRILKYLVPKYHMEYLWVEVYLSTVYNHLVQLARTYSKSHTCNMSIWKAKLQDTPSEMISRQTSSPTALHTSTSICGYYQWPAITSPRCWRCTVIPFSAATSHILHTS